MGAGEPSSAARAPDPADDLEVATASEARPAPDPQPREVVVGKVRVRDLDGSLSALLAELPVGTVVDDKYRIDQIIGGGAMGVVAVATHEGLGERVAIKFLRHHQGTDIVGFQSRFRREAKVCAKLRNEHITRVIDVGLWRSRVPFMVMDYLVGTDLSELLKSGGPLPIRVALDYAVQLCEGIAEAHGQGIVHRDIKPANLFITKRPDGSDLLKILDFGISKWTAGEVQLDDLTQTGVVLGSPRYMSPEQLFGASEVDARSDIWSIGAVIYEMLGGRPPYDYPAFSKICAVLATNDPPPSLKERRPDVPAELEAAVMRCFGRTPENRAKDVAELAGALLAPLHARVAESTRRRIAATLDARAGHDADVSQSGGRTLEALSAALDAGPSPAEAAPPSAAQTPVVSSVRAPKLGGRALLAVVAAAVLAGAAATALMLSRHGDASSQVVQPSQQTQGAPEGSAVPAAHGTPSDPPSSAIAGESSAAPPATTATAVPSASASNQPAAVHAGRSFSRPGTPSRPTAVAPSVATAVSTPSSPPTMTVPPAPTPGAKVDPLGDRQ